MIKRYFILAILLTSITCVWSETNNIESVLSEIETNNLTLKTLREEHNAQKLSNKSDIALSNPEIEFNYIWGADNPTRGKGFAVSQEFDFQTILGYKSSVARTQNTLIDIIYKRERINLLLEAKTLCYDLIYYNALFKELNERLSLAEKNVSLFKMRFDNGDVSILEYNKAKLEYALSKGELANIEAEREEILSQLTILNGGKEVILNIEQFDIIAPLPLFDVWYSEAEALNPVLEYARNEMELSEKEIKLNRSAWAPKLSAEYSREWGEDSKNNGFKIGMSIPLWADINKVKSAKANASAIESRKNELEINFYYQIKNDYEKSIILQKSAAETKAAVEQLSNLKYLDKALDSGEITMLDYIIEVDMYYDARIMALDAEKAYYISLAKLSSYTL